MNLKEAFRYQNKIQRLMDEAEILLRNERNVTKVTNIALRHKANPEAEDETTLEIPDIEYVNQITEMTTFLLFLLDQHERLSYAIRAAKQRMDLDFDSEVSLNSKRQEIAGIFRRMSEIRCCENKFNAEGNQISYRCDLKKVTTINFDRNKVRALASGLSKKADQVSAALDKQLVIAEVDYAPCFDVNDTFADVFRQYISQNS